jgi:hypothetical protein
MNDEFGISIWVSFERALNLGKASHIYFSRPSRLRGKSFPYSLRSLRALRFNYLLMAKGLGLAIEEILQDDCGGVGVLAGFFLLAG